MLPPPSLSMRVLVRGLMVYILLRGVANQASGQFAKEIGEPHTGLSLPALAVLFLILYYVLRLAAARRRELTLMNNLGVATSTVAGVGLIPGLAVELAMVFLR